MAKTDRFYIGLVDGSSGMQTDVKPFLIADNAFQTLNNAYVFRGRVRKRFGSRLMKGSTTPNPGYEQLQSRLRINIGTTDGAGGFTGLVPASVSAGNYTPYAPAAIGQAFSVGDQIYTLTVLSGAATPLLNTGAGTGTYDTTAGTPTSGQLVLVGAAILTPVYFYPSLPVMGLVTYQEKGVNSESIFAFDTRFAYQFTASGWTRLGTAIWSGSDADFFWGYNWNGILRSDYYMFVTNFVSADRIKYWDGASAWTTISPIINNTTRIATARIVLPFKDRLIMLNTVEYAGNNGTAIGTTNAVTGNLAATVVAAPAGGFAIGQSFVVGTTIFTIDSLAAGAQPMAVAAINSTGAVASATFNITTSEITITGNNTNRNQGVYFLNATTGSDVEYKNRCRYSLNGSPVATNSFLEVAGGGGGYIDAPTKEAIVTAQFLKDRLIVYFEQSTWELAYTGNQVLPYVWQQINTELGAESTFSQVPFDKVVLGVGNVGIMACSGSSVERIDNNIPDEVFAIHNANNGIERVAGIRDYYVEMVYWTFPDVTRSSTYPFNNKVLTYNYKTGSWGMNDDSITAFGYYQSAANEGETWASDNGTWETDNSTWTDGPTIQARFRSVLAGNQEGFVFVVDPDENRNSPALQITDMVITDATTITVTCVNHNFQPGFNGIGDYIAIEKVQGLSGITDMIFPVNDVTDANTFTIKVDNGSVTGTYTGGGTIARVSNIDITTKQYNFYAQDGCNASINKVDFLVDKTSGGEITVDYYISSSGISSLNDGAATGALLGTGVLETKPYTLVPLESAQDRLWHPIYPMSDGQYIQLNLYMTDEQLRDASIAWSDFEWHSTIYYAMRTSSRLQ